MNEDIEDAEIVAQEDALLRAMMTNDVSALEQLLDDDLAFVTMTGGIADKAMDIAAHRARLLRLTSMAPSERRIRRYGDVAIVIVRMDAVGTYDGIPFDNALRYLRVWRRDGDQWRIVSGGMGVVQD